MIYLAWIIESGHVKKIPKKLALKCASESCIKLDSKMAWGWAMFI